MEATLQIVRRSHEQASPLDGARLAVSALFFANGAIIGAWVSRIPALQASLRLSDGVLGLALLGLALGALVSMPVAGWLSERFGSNRVCRLSVFGCAALLPLIALAPGAVLFGCALFAFGAVHGGLDISMNAQAVAVEKRIGRSIMSSFHALFSAGGLAGAATGGVIAAHGIVPWEHFALVATVLVGAAAVCLPWLLARAPVEEGSAAIVLRRPNRLLIALGSVAFCCMMGEGAMADWTALFLKRTLHASEGWAAAGFAAFSVTMALTRFCGDAICARLGATRLVRLGGALATGGLVLALTSATPSWALAGFAAVGAGLATVVPMTFSAAGRAPGVSPAIALATVTTIGYFGFLAGPPLIGFVAEMIGLPHALWIVAGASALIALLAGNLRGVGG